MSKLVECNPPWSSYSSDNANAPCKLTFERVVALPNARISILPLPGAQGNKHSISVCSQSHGDHNQQQARLNIGKVTSSGFQLAVLEDAEELDSFGAKASEGQRVGWPWKRMPSDCIVSVSNSVNNPFTVYRVCHSSLPKHQAKVQSILLAIGSSIKALRGHSSECVFLCVDRRDHIVGILATESILRSHTLSRAAPSPQAEHRAGIHLKQQNRPPATTGDHPRSSPRAAQLSAKQPEQPSTQLRHASTIPPAKKQLTLFQALGGSLHGRSKQSPRPAPSSRIQSTPASFCHSPEYQQTPSLDPVHAMLPCMAQCPALPSSDTCLLRPSTRCPNIPLRCSSDPPRNANRWLGAAAAPMAPGSAPDIRPYPSAPQPHHTAAMSCVHNLADELDMTPRHCTEATCLANACAHGGIPLCMRLLPDGNGTISPCPHLQARPNGPPVRPPVKVLPRQARTHANGGRLARMRAGVTSSKADLATARKDALVGAPHDRQPHATDITAPLGPVSNKTSTQRMQTRTSVRSSEGGTVRDSSTEQPCLVPPDGSESLLQRYASEYRQAPDGSEPRQAAGGAAEGQLGSRPPHPLAPPGHAASDGRLGRRNQSRNAVPPTENERHLGVCIKAADSP
eukprot:jgi/Ulvmu1/10082/UM006_0029.1